MGENRGPERRENGSALMHGVATLSLTARRSDVQRPESTLGGPALLRNGHDARKPTPKEVLHKIIVTFRKYLYLYNGLWSLVSGLCAGPRLASLPVARPEVDVEG